MRGGSANWKPRELVCAACGKKFVATHWHAKYCSPKCKAEAARLNARRRYREDANDIRAKRRAYQRAHSAERNANYRANRAQRVRLLEWRRRVTNAISDAVALISSAYALGIPADAGAKVLDARRRLAAAMRGEFDRED
jgi:hypothetical protein